MGKGKGLACSLSPAFSLQLYVPTNWEALQTPILLGVSGSSITQARLIQPPAPLPSLEGLKLPTL